MNARSKSSRLSYNVVVSQCHILEKYLDVKQICQTQWCPLFQVHGVYQQDINVKIMIAD
jgi:hypothetical protein